MKHVNALTCMPERAAIAPEVKLTFLADVFDAAVPLFENKNAQNPLPPDDTDGTGTTT